MTTVNYRFEEQLKNDDEIHNKPVQWIMDLQAYRIHGVDDLNRQSFVLKNYYYMGTFI